MQQMNQETLNIFLIVFLVIITGCIITITYFLIRALKAVITLADHAIETAESIKSKLQLRALTAIPSLLLTLVKNFRKRG